MSVAVARVIFWIALLTTAYVYAGYPLLLKLWQKLGSRSIRKQYQEPDVSLIIAMHNEAANVASKMRNCRDLDYPRGKLEVIVSLDAPTDGTDALLEPYASDGVQVLSTRERSGKAVALNAAAARATGEILIFADARQRFESSAIRELVANFADESVGAVSGELILLDEHGRESSDGAGAYWRYEKSLRAMESDIHSVPGATGAILALRRSLFQPLARGTLLDDVVLPMRAVLAGYRSVLDPQARAYDIVEKSAEREYGRKRRTLAGNYQLLVEMPELVTPWRNPILVQFISHKVGRLLIPYCLAALFVANAFLLSGGGYLAMFVAQLFWYGLAAAGWLISVRDKVIDGTVPSSQQIRSRV